MRAAGALLLATVLSGCAAGGDTPAEPAETATPQDAAASDPADTPLPDDYAGTAWQVSDADGARYITHLDPDGTYRDLRNGDPLQQGTWSVDAEDRICFSAPFAQDEDATDAEGLETCWRPHHMAGEGELLLHGQSGRRIMATRVEYSPADEDNDTSAQ